MNPELEEAKKKLREGVLAYVRAVFKSTGSAEIAVLMLATEFQNACESITDADLVAKATPEEGGTAAARPNSDGEGEEKGEP